jgi:hypothetical protein
VAVKVEIKSALKLGQVFESAPPQGQARLALILPREAGGVEIALRVSGNAGLETGRFSRVTLFSTEVSLALEFLGAGVTGIVRP